MITKKAASNTALRLKAHNVLMQANEKLGYEKAVASKAAFLAIKEMPADVRTRLCQRIVEGEENMVDLYRWPLCSCGALGTTGKHTAGCPIIELQSVL